MTDGKAYFISPGGHIVDVPEKHIRSVIADPERFGLTRRRILAAYARYHEPMGMEGSAREALLKAVLRNGWIRVREHVGSHWAFEFARWSPLTKRMSRRWAARVVRQGAGIGRDAHLLVVLAGLDGTRIDVPLIDLASRKKARPKAQTSTVRSSARR